MLFQQTAALAALLSFASAQSIRGFNSGAAQLSGAAKTQSDFQAEFENQQKLEGTKGVFTNARLYTMIQGGTKDTPISAIPAAIDTNTGLLLGLWASAGQDIFDDELNALTNAITQYGSDFTDLVRGISVGSEDLYRSSATGVKNDAGVGVGPDVVADYIGQLRNTISGTPLSNALVGHVDTWTAWVNGSNSAVTDACDWVGVDAYPYYEMEVSNGIDNAGDLFFEAYDKTEGATGKPVWVTETGWPDSGPTVGDAVASPENARSFWEQVYCRIPANVPVYWYTQKDANAVNEATFGVTGGNLSPEPVYDLTCPAVVSSSSSSSATPTPSSTSADDSEASTTRTGGVVAPTGNGGSTTLATTTASPTSDASETETSYVFPTTDAGTSISISSVPILTSSTTSSTPDSTSTSSPTSPSPSLMSTNTPTSSSGAEPTGTEGAQTTGPNSAGNVQVGALIFLIVPAIFAFMA